MSEEATLSSEEADQMLTVLDTCLEEGYDIEGVEEDVLERAREKIEEAR